MITKKFLVITRKIVVITRKFLVFMSNEKCSRYNKKHSNAGNIRT